MSEVTTSAPSFEKCGYCGNYHNYSYEMCRDMNLKQHLVINVFKALDNISDEIGVKHETVNGEVI